MRRQTLILFALLIFNHFQNFAQEVKENVIIDSLNFPRQQKFEEHVDLLIKNKYLNFEENKVFSLDILNTPEKAKIFSINLALINYPQSKYFIEKYFQISEDKTKRLWFVRTRLGEPGKVTDGELSIIIRKNDCKVIQFTNFL